MVLQCDHSVSMRTKKKVLNDLCVEIDVKNTGMYCRGSGTELTECEVEYLFLSIWKVDLDADSAVAYVKSAVLQQFPNGCSSKGCHALLTSAYKCHSLLLVLS